MRIYAIDRLDKYARQKVLQGSKTWELYRTIAAEDASRLVGTMLVRLEAEFENPWALEFLQGEKRKPEEL